MHNLLQWVNDKPDDPTVTHQDLTIRHGTIVQHAIVVKGHGMLPTTQLIISRTFLSNDPQTLIDFKQTWDFSKHHQWTPKTATSQENDHLSVLMRLHNSKINGALFTNHLLTILIHN